MKKVKFLLEELEMCFIALSYLCSNVRAREEYKILRLDNEIEFPSNELDIISNIIINYVDQENMLENFKIAKEFTELNKYSEITACSLNGSSEFYYKNFIERIKGNVDELDNVLLTSYPDNKKAFISYIGGNFKALVNSDNEYKFIKWNGKAWIKLTEEEGKIVYGDFIKECEFHLAKVINIVEKEEFIKLNKKISSWDSKNKVNEALDKIKRDRCYIADYRKYNSDDNIICSKNGKIINFNTGSIRDSNRNDMILNTSKYNLVDKEKANEFVRGKFKMYEDVLGAERLEFLLDLIAYKMLGKNLQKGIFLIGGGATGKSTFKNIMKDLFEGNVTNINYDYFTIKHKGNEDSSRDDLLVSLNNKLFGLSSEGDTTDIINQARFKSILSNSTETARQTRGRLVEVNLQRLDLLIDTNAIPQFTNFDDAINRRLLFIRFINKIPVEERNPNFYIEEIKPNFDYIFSFFVYRAQGIINNKFEVPQCIKDDTLQNVKELDSLTKFVSEKLEHMDESYITCEELEHQYNKLCSDNDLVNIIPENITNAAARYNFLINRIRDKPGFENISRIRKSAGSHNSKQYIARGLIFKEENVDVDNIFRQEILV